MGEIAVIIAVAIAVAAVASCSAKMALTRWRIRKRAAVPTGFESDDLGRGDADAFPEFVLFSTPYCVPCRRIKDALGAAGADLAVVDLSEKPDLAKRYDVRTTPTLFELDSDGEIKDRFVNSGAEQVSSRRAAASRP